MAGSVPNQVFAEQQIDLGGIASRYSPMLFRIALGRLRNVEDAEDAVQDALLSAHKHIGQFEGRSQLSSWLTRIVINASGMKLRSRPRQELVSLDQAREDGETTFANQVVDARPNPETICAQTEMEETVRAALDHISPKLRVAFEMREIAGFSTRETAYMLRIRTTALKSRLRRARAAIRSLSRSEQIVLSPCRRIDDGICKSKRACFSRHENIRRRSKQSQVCKAQPNFSKCCGKITHDASIRTLKTKDEGAHRDDRTYRNAPSFPFPLPQSDSHAEEFMTFTA